MSHPTDDNQPSITNQAHTRYGYESTANGVVRDPLANCWRCQNLQFFANYGDFAAQSAACASVCNSSPGCGAPPACPITMPPCATVASSRGLI